MWNISRVGMPLRHCRFVKQNKIKHKTAREKKHTHTHHNPMLLLLTRNDTNRKVMRLNWAVLQANRAFQRPARPIARPSMFYFAIEKQVGSAGWRHRGWLTVSVEGVAADLVAMEEKTLAARYLNGESHFHPTGRPFVGMSSTPWCSEKAAGQGGSCNKQDLNKNKMMLQLAQRKTNRQRPVTFSQWIPIFGWEEPSL